MFSGRHELMKNGGFIFVDRNPTMFRYVLDYLRNDEKMPNIRDEMTRRLFGEELKHWKLIQYDPNKEKPKEVS